MRRNLIFSAFFVSTTLVTLIASPGVPAAAPSEALVAQATVEETTRKEVITRETTIKEGVPTTRSRTEIIVQETPPPLREEPMGVAPSPAYVWAPGYWTWSNGWVWNPGHWELPPQRTTVWVPGQWVRTDRGWMWQPGQWQQQ